MGMTEPTPAEEVSYRRCSEVLTGPISMWSSMSELRPQMLDTYVCMPTQLTVTKYLPCDLHGLSHLSWFHDEENKRDFTCPHLHGNASSSVHSSLELGLLRAVLPHIPATHLPPFLPVNLIHPVSLKLNAASPALTCGFLSRPSLHTAGGCSQELL